MGKSTINGHWLPPGCWLLDAEVNFLLAPAGAGARGLGSAEDGLLYWSVMGVPDGAGCTSSLEDEGSWGRYALHHFSRW